MRQLWATLRRRPAPLVGTFVSLTVAALLVTVTTIFIGTGLTLSVRAERLAAASVIVAGNPNVSVHSGNGDNAETDVLPLPDYRRVPTKLAHRLAGVPGVDKSVADFSIPIALVLPNGAVTTGSSANPIEGHGWTSAVLTPFTVKNGRPPLTSDEIDVGTGLASRTGLTVGSLVRLAGQELPPFHVVGVVGTGRGNPAQDWTVFFSDPEAAALYGHPGQADLIALIARPGVSTTNLFHRVQAALGRSRLTVLSGLSIGNMEDLATGTDKVGLLQLATTGGIDVVAIAFFVVAGTVALSVAQRWRNLALLRAVGATPGQVRRMIMLELVFLGALAGLAGYFPALWLANWALQGLAAHQLLPPDPHPWNGAWVVFIAAGAGILVAEIAGLVSVRRVSRIRPAAALVEATVEPRLIHPLRLLLGVCALGGGATMCGLMISGSFSTQLVLTFAILAGLLFMVAIALLGPLLVRFGELLVRLPLLLISGQGGRLALADIRRRPRRMATAVSAVALGVAFVGAEYLIDVTQTHGAVVEGQKRLVANLVVSAPGPGLAPSALPAIATETGVASAVGLIPTTVFVPDPSNDTNFAEAVTSGELSNVLNLNVVSGSLDHFGPGDIALSKLITGTDAVSAHVGDTIKSYLADGTPYRAKVVAIYSQSLGFADVVVPSEAVGGGHFGTSNLAQVLVRGSPGVSPETLSNELSSLASRFANLTVASRSVVNAQAQIYLAQQTYGNNLVLGEIILLASVALVNTLIMATVERRNSIWLLRRVGATNGQLLSMTVWQTLILDVFGLTLGALGGAASVVVVSKALAGTWTPYITWPPMATIAAVVICLTVVAILVPTLWILAAPMAEE